MARVSAALLLLGVPCASACDETPRGDQGLDFLDDGGYYNVPPGPDAGPDAHGPCANETDSAGTCAQASVNGTPAAVLVACTGTARPADITCTAPGQAVDGGLITYCCTTGIL
jgi:hypothetical protein